MLSNIYIQWSFIFNVTHIFSSKYLLMWKFIIMEKTK